MSKTAEKTTSSLTSLTSFPNSLNAVPTISTPLKENNNKDPSKKRNNQDLHQSKLVLQSDIDFFHKEILPTRLTSNTDIIAHLKTGSRQRLYYKALNNLCKETVTKELNSYLNYSNNLRVTTDIFSHQIKKQNIWIPNLQIESKYIAQDAISSNHKLNSFSDPNEIFKPLSKDIFNGVAYYPKLLGETKIPGLVYHNSVEINDTVYIMGGLRSNFENTQCIDDISNFYVDGLDDLPAPLDKDVINNPNMVGNKKFYSFNTISNSFREHVPRGDVPSALLCCKGSKISERYIFYYGGFEIITELINYQKDPKTNEKLFFLKSRALINNTGYILDIATFTYTKVELVARPSKYFSYPTTVPRFGHSQTVVLKSKSLDKFSLSCTNTIDDSINTNKKQFPDNIMIIIFGGYKQVGDSKYEPMNDLWSVELPVLEKGVNNYMRFTDTAFATMHKNSLMNITFSTPSTTGNTPVMSLTSIPTINSSAENSRNTTTPNNIQWPCARGFQSATIVQRSNFEKKSIKDTILQNLIDNYKVKTARRRSSNHYHNFNLRNGSSYGALQSDGSTPSISSIKTASAQNNSSHHSTNELSAVRKKHVQNMSVIDDSDMEVLLPVSSSSVSFDDDYEQLNVDNSYLVIHGGTYNEDTLGDFWCFDFSSETWEQKFLEAPNLIEPSLYKPINLNLCGHEMFSSGEYAILMGGLSSSCKNYTRENHSLVTLVHLPTLRVLNVKQIDDFEVEDQDIRILGSPIRGSNGIYYMLGGVFMHIVKRDKMDPAVLPSLGEGKLVGQEIKTPLMNAVVSDYTVTQNYLHGAILASLSPTVSVKSQTFS
ncbi:hypothetical protein ACO0QE_003853 [Hanseniaspora vineae]